MPAAKRTVRVVLVDDDHGFLAVLHALLEGEPEIEVVGSAENGEQAIELARSLQPDLITMDLEMPKVDGVEATKQIKKRWPTIEVIVVSASIYADRAARAREAGASGYVPKSRVADELAATILAVALGENLPLVE